MTRNGLHPVDFFSDWWLWSEKTSTEPSAFTMRAPDVAPPLLTPDPTCHCSTVISSRWDSLGGTITCPRCRGRLSAISNPARDVKPLRYESDGFHTWSPDEVKQFEGPACVGAHALHGGASACTARRSTSRSSSQVRRSASRRSMTASQRHELRSRLYRP